MHGMEIKDRFRKFLPVVVDLETAGFNEHTDALLEVSMVMLKMDAAGVLLPDEQYSANIRPFPGANLEKPNLDFLGIDPFDESRRLLSEEEALPPMFKAVSRAIRKHSCTRAVLVGHNGFFDLKFLLAAAARIGYKRCPFHPFSVLDTATLSSLMFGHSVLVRACRAAGIAFDDGQAHGAVYDAAREAELFCAIYNRYTIHAGIPGPLADE